MSDVDEYRKRLEGSASGGNTEDYYKLARDQEYSLLLNKEVALENAKSNAMKYTQNQINAQGFGGTGYGSSMQSGIYNNYMNKANEAYANYGEGIKNINMQENEANLAKANDRFQSITTMLQGADSTDSMNKLLSDYKYGTIDEKTGEFTWNKTKPEGMSDDDWYQMQYYYGMQKNAFDQASNSNASASSLSDLQNMTFEINGGEGHKGEEHHNGTVSTLGEWFGEEAKALMHRAQNGGIEKDAVIKVTNGRNDVIYLQWTGNGYKQVNESAYNSASKKHTLTHKDKQNYWDE